MKIFNLYDVSEVKVEDPGLKRYINLDAKLLPKTKGKAREKFGKGKVNVVERLINVLGTPGHRGKKHKIMTRVSGKYSQGAKIVLETFKLIQERTRENPIQVLVRAIENSAPRDEITTIEYGGARYPQAVDISPLRRINLALHNIVHGAHDKAFGSKKKIYETLANEIILASQKSNESFAVTKKIEMEKQADSAR
ncbi:MAG: 30S ribosomal protein S7 [Candidatus Pacearchaeota archaeon]|nr:30S ribosomal protein S7 [Candidatus Pacearchaeota archaeon]